MKSTQIIITGVIVVGLAGCASRSVAPPSEIQINAEPFIIDVQKNVNNSDTLLKGVKLSSFTNTRGEAPIYYFYSVSFKQDIINSELITEACRGTLHSSGSKYKSCIYFYSKVKVSESNDHYEIEIKPTKKRLVQGHNAVFFPIDLPSANVDKLYEWISNQSVSINAEYTTEFPPESIKANFDRNLPKYTWERGESNAASKQYKDTYSLELNNNVSVKIGTSVYPYKNGSLIKTRIFANHKTMKNIQLVDWSKILQNVSKKIDLVVNQ